MKIPGTAKLVSLERRLERFLSHTQLSAFEWYKPLSRHWLKAASQTTGEIRLIIDGTKIGFGFQLIVIALAFHRRAIPLAWLWLRYRKGHSSAQHQITLVQRVRHLLPTNARVTLVGDTEFESGALQQCLTTWGWHYALRQKPNNLFQLTGTAVWRAFDTLITQAGQRCWLEQVQVTAKHTLTTNIFAYWKSGEPGPWLLATNFPSFSQTLRAYSRRMWIEEMFGDLKRHGFDLQSTHLRQVYRLSRLTLAVFLLYIWLLLLGARTVKAGSRPLVDRKDRRDLSLFQIGLRVLERRLANLNTFRVFFFPNLPKLSGS